MAKTGKARIALYFINGPLPSEEDAAVARELAGEGYQVMFRNARYINPEDTIEAFDELAGAIPDNYAEAKVAKSEAAEARRAAFAPDDAPPGPAKTKPEKAPKPAKTPKATKPAPAADPARAGALAALSGGQGQGDNVAPPAITPAAPQTPPAGGSGDLTGGWGTNPPAPPATPPAWKPNA